MHLRYVAAALLLTSMTVCGQTETQIVSPAPSTGFLKHLTIESFGYGHSANAVSDEFAPGNTSAFYNLHQLTCPLCIGIPPLGRTRAVLPPFGAKATYGMWRDRLILAAGFGGIDAIPGDNTPRFNPMLMRATSFNDDWIVSSDVGARISVDPQKQLSVGITQRYVNDFGPATNGWRETTGGLTFTPGLFHEVAHGVKKIQKRSKDNYQDRP
jgi:hypothetical protein